MKKFIVEDSFWELFPEAQFGGVYAVGIDNSEEGTKRKMSRIKSSLSAGCVQAGKYLAEDRFEDNKVVRVWRQAFEKFPHPEGAQSSVEILLKTGHEKGEIESVNALVDICNSDSLIWALPICVFDADKIAGDLRLGVREGELCYYDDAGPLTRAWVSEQEGRGLAGHDVKNAR